MKKQAAPIVPDTLSPLDNMLLSFKRSCLARNLSHSTVISYVGTIGRLSNFLKAQGMPLDPAGITREHVETFSNWLRSTPVARTGRPPKYDSLKQWYSSLRVFFNWLVEVGEISVSPMDKMSPPKGQSTRRPVLSEEHIKRILKVCEGTGFTSRRDLALIRLFIDTGLRVTEMINIRLEDIDWERQAITIQHGKGDKMRIVYFGRRTAKALDQYVFLKGGRRDHRCAGMPFLWLGIQGHFRRGGINRMLDRRAKEAGIGHIHAHLWRHYFIHASLKAGANPGDIMRQTGHTKLEMLLHYGQDAADERARESHRRLGPGDNL